MSTGTTAQHDQTTARSAKESKKQRPRRPMALLDAYAEQPGEIRFETQQAEETVELFLRQHWIVNLPAVILALVMAFAPTVIIPVFASGFRLPFAVPAGYLIVVMAFWYLATVGFIIANFIHWYFNIYIVTNERIVDIDFLFLLYKKFSVADLSKIQDISYTEKGLLSTIFDFGTVFVQTASEVPTIEFESVPHPERVVEKIRELTDALGGSHHE
jgi:membrane protein YdbS with pleckstrin-like domain